MRLDLATYLAKGAQVCPVCIQGSVELKEPSAATNHELEPRLLAQCTRCFAGWYHTYGLRNVNCAKCRKPVMPDFEVQEAPSYATTLSATYTCPDCQALQTLRFKLSDIQDYRQQLRLRPEHMTQEGSEWVYKGKTATVRIQPPIGGLPAYLSPRHWVGKFASTAATIHVEATRGILGLGRDVHLRVDGDNVFTLPGQEGDPGPVKPFEALTQDVRRMLLWQVAEFTFEPVFFLVTPKGEVAQHGKELFEVINALLPPGEGTP